MGHQDDCLHKVCRAGIQVLLILLGGAPTVYLAQVAYNAAENQEKWIRIGAVLLFVAIAIGIILISEALAPDFGNFLADKIKSFSFFRENESRHIAENNPHRSSYEPIHDIEALFLPPSYDAVVNLPSYEEDAMSYSSA